jgi:hypothetical protein
VLAHSLNIDIHFRISFRHLLRHTNINTFEFETVEFFKIRENTAAVPCANFNISLKFLKFILHEALLAAFKWFKYSESEYHVVILNYCTVHNHKTLYEEFCFK